MESMKWWKPINVEDLMAKEVRSFYVRKEDVDKYGYTPGCEGSNAIQRKEKRALAPVRSAGRVARGKMGPHAGGEST